MFWRWTTVYFIVAGFYAFTGDAVWEAIRGVLPDFLVGWFFFLCGPIVSTDFIHFFSVWPFILETLVVLLLLSIYLRTTHLRYLVLIGGVWIFSLQTHAELMGRLA